MFVLRLRRGEAGRVVRNDEPGRAVGSHGEDGDHVGDRSVRDPLLATVDPVAGDDAVLLDAGGGRLHRAEVTPGVGLGGAVREDHTVFGDRAQPSLALVVGGPDENRVASEECGEDGRCEADVVAGHHFADSIRVERSPVHPAVGLGDEHQLHAELLRVAHRPDDVLRADVLVVELELALGGQFVADELAERVEHHQEHVGVETGTAEVAVDERHERRSPRAERAGVRAGAGEACELV